MTAMGGTVLAGSSDDDGGSQSFFSRIADKLGLTEDEVNEAAIEAQQEMREEAQQERLVEAVEDGVLTQEEANEIQVWWDARPEVLGDPEVRQALHPKGGHGKHSRFGDCDLRGGMMMGGVDIEG